MIKKFKVCCHNEILGNCPICKDLTDSPIEIILEKEKLDEQKNP